jgi:N-acetylglucosamine malate deacetylase 1
VSVLHSFRERAVATVRNRRLSRSWQTLVDGADDHDRVAPHASVLVIAPHCDDEVLGVGGLIAARRAQGDHVDVIIGAGATALRVAHRRSEARAAVERLGVDADCLAFLGFDDGEQADHSAVATRLAIQISQLKTAPDVVYAVSSYDPHPDHAGLGRAVHQLVSDRQIVAPVFEYPIWQWLGSSVWAEWVAAAQLGPHRRAQRCQLTRWHAVKRAALSEHRSQVEATHGVAVIGPEVIERFFRSHEVFLPSPPHPRPTAFFESWDLTGFTSTSTAAP